MDLLMDFRISYLKAISLAWNDDEFKNKLLESDNVLDLFSSRGERDRFNSYQNPFSNLIVTVSDSHEVKWDDSLINNWFGPNDYIDIYLPEKPQNDSDSAEALAQFYYLFPDIMGPIKKNGSSLDNSQGSSVLSRGSQSSQLGISGDKFTDFGALMLKVISLSWENNKFLDELYSASGPEDAKDNQRFDSSPVLSKYFAYNNPWNFNLRFRSAENFKFEEVNGLKQWVNIPSNHINLWFPSAPKSEKIRPIALASYNSNGAAYPFTCS